MHHEGDGDKRYWLPEGYEAVTDERWAKGDLEEFDSDRGGKETRSFADLLTFYERKGDISRRQRRAGHKLHQLWYHGCLASKYVLMRYGDPTGTGDSQASGLLYVEYRDAMKAVRGVPERRVAYNVCCAGDKAGRGNMETLRNALTDLALHFRMES